MLQTFRPDSISIAGITWGQLGLWLELRREISPKGGIVCTARAVVPAFPEAGRIVKGQPYRLGFSIGDESWETDNMTVAQSRRADKGHGERAARRRDLIVVTLASCAETARGDLDAFHKIPCNLERGNRGGGPAMRAAIAPQRHVRSFPIQGPGGRREHVPWWLAEVAYAFYSENFPGQSMEELAERGGFGREELVAFIRREIPELTKEPPSTAKPQPGVPSDAGPGEPK
jgi:hypothetical protein